MSIRRVDIHQHLVPPAYRSWQIEHNLEAGPEWSSSAALAMMDEHDMRAGILSIATPGVHLGNDAEARYLAREVNEFAAEVVKDQPDRFGFLATLTLPDVDGALAEAAYTLDTLGADGVVLLANTHGRYLGEDAFEPLLAELGRRGAVVFVHPSELPGPAVPGIPPFAADYLLDTVRAAINLVRSGTLTRHPDLKVILSHGGGFLPYAAHRIVGGLSLTEGRDSAELMAEFRRFYLETGLSTSPTSLPSLFAFAEPDHILYGSDWPYAPDAIVGYFAGYLDSLATPEQRAAIDYGNAHALFPRLADSPQ